jgi:phosphoribosylamine-glycine ligase
VLDQLLAEHRFGTERVVVEEYLDGEQIVTAGGRLLSVTALGVGAAAARASAYAAVDMIDFPGRQVRRDIAPRAVR